MIEILQTVFSQIMAVLMQSWNHEYDYLWKTPKVKTIRQYKAVHPLENHKALVLPYFQLCFTLRYLILFSNEVWFRTPKILWGPLNSWDLELQRVWKNSVWEELVLIALEKRHSIGNLEGEEMSAFFWDRWIIGINKLSVIIISSGRNFFPNSFYLRYN